MARHARRQAVDGLFEGAIGTVGVPQARLTAGSIMKVVEHVLALLAEVVCNELLRGRLRVRTANGLDAHGEHLAENKLRPE